MKLSFLLAAGCLLPFAAGQAPRESVGLTPLTDLGKGSYKGEQGGLYPGGENAVPPEHFQAGLKLARMLVPRDAEGTKSPAGKIVLLSIGFSNPSIESGVFVSALNNYSGRNPRLVAINGCVGSRAAPTIADPNSDYWQTVDQRINDAGVTNKQVQAIWMKQVIPGSGQFPAYPKRLQGYLQDSLHNAQDRFPNLKLAYLSSRTYGGVETLGRSMGPPPSAICHPTRRRFPTQPAPSTPLKSKSTPRTRRTTPLTL